MSILSELFGLNKSKKIRRTRPRKRHLESNQQNVDVKRFTETIQQFLTKH
ncbi:hypothetical protein U8V72_20155 [Priestia filamentosa]